MPSPKTILQQYINQRIKLSEADFESFFQRFELKHYQAKEHLLEAGQTCRYYYFMINGLVRFYNIDNKGKEDISAFAIEQWWFTQMESFIAQHPSTHYIQAIENSAILVISFNELEEAYNQIPALNRLFRILTQKTLIAKERRHDLFMKKNSRDRYQHLVTALPAFAQRVPQYMLAAYLDMTPEYLSELRKQARDGVK